MTKKLKDNLANQQEALESAAEEVEVEEEMIDMAEGKYPKMPGNINKKGKNKAPSFIFDYWTTNRETERENARRQEEEHTNEKPWSKTEIGMLVVIIVCVALLAIKYIPRLLG